MTYKLHLGDPSYSSWSLRGWLLFEKFNIPTETVWVDFSSRDVGKQLAACAPARTVPCLRTPEGATMWDSLAIAEELATRHPAAGLWPDDPAARATARTMTAEMHSAFGALRNECPMNLRAAYRHSDMSDEIRKDVERLEEIWAFARDGYSDESPWLFGSYSIADAFFAPAAARIAGYNLGVAAQAKTYVAAHLADPAFRRWRAMGAARGADLPWYSRDFPQTGWPGPVPIPAKRSDHGPALNQTCPFSGRPVAHFAEISGRIIGFCNAVCRNKFVADPEAWPDAMDVMMVNEI